MNKEINPAKNPPKAPFQPSSFYLNILIIAIIDFKMNVIEPVNPPKRRIPSDVKDSMIIDGLFVTFFKLNNSLRILNPAPTPYPIRKDFKVPARTLSTHGLHDLSNGVLYSKILNLMP